MLRSFDMRSTIDILGVKIDKITAAYALKKAEQMVRKPGVSTIFTPNPEIVMAAYEDPSCLLYTSRCV